MTEQLNRIEQKVDSILHWIQASTKSFANEFGDPTALCSLCFSRIEYMPLLDGTVKRVCGCRLPVQSIAVDNFKKKEV
jgi:hypothetical protein